MSQRFDYLYLGDGNYPNGSAMQQVSELVKYLRHLREGVSASDIAIYMPKAREMEARLQHFDKQINEPHCDYIQEIWSALQNETPEDDSLMYEVFEVDATDSTNVRLVETFEKFYHERKAIRWIKDSGSPETNYIILQIRQKAAE